MKGRPPHFVAAMFALALLSGCFGGGKPAQLYRLNTAAGPPPDPAIPPRAITRTILLLPVRFDPAIEGDKLLTSHGQETSYIARARWVSPAPTLFEQALRNAVRRRTPGVALVDRRDGIVACCALQIAVVHFETRYAASGAAPLIVVEGEARLIDLKTHTPTGSLAIATSRQADSNDIAAIVAAFDGATADAVDRTADWLAHTP